MNWLLLAIGMALLAALIAAAAAVMLIMGRRAEARALVTFLPDCAVSAGGSRAARASHASTSSCSWRSSPIWRCRST
jgi:membrane protein implicated in regulation of membrane protease activity